PDHLLRVALDRSPHRDAPRLLGLHGKGMDHRGGGRRPPVPLLSASERNLVVSVTESSDVVLVEVGGRRLTGPRGGSRGSLAAAAEEDHLAGHDLRGVALLTVPVLPLPGL